MIKKNSILSNLFDLRTSIEDLIRLGSPNDGGYVVSKRALDNSDVLYTYGVFNDYQFEEDYINIYPSKTVKMFDHTVDYEHNLKNNIYFKKEPLFINNDDTKNSFINHLIEYNDNDKKIFLKLDVENYEYEFFTYLSNNIYILSSITGMAIEFHSLESTEYFEKFKNIINKLKNYFVINHIHANNFANYFNLGESICPNVIEISFCNLELAKDFNCSQMVYPIYGLDTPNDYSKPDYRLFI